jgi:hypothetical protein
MKTRALFLLLVSVLTYIGGMPAQAALIVAQNTSPVIKIGPFVDSTGALQTGLTINATDVRLSKNGATGSAKNSGACTHDSNFSGYYTCTFNTVDTATVGPLQISVAVSGALPVYEELQVLSGNAYNALYSSTADSLPAIGGAVPKLGITDSGTAQSVTSTTIQLASAATFGDSTPVGQTVLACSSTLGYCQAGVIGSYVGSTDTATLANSATWPVTPTGTITYYMFGTAPASGSGGSLTAGDVWAYSGGRTVTGVSGSVTGSVASVTGAVGSVTGNVGGNVTGSVGSIATGGITAASIATDAITSAKIANDAIGATEIADGAIDAATFASGAITAAAIATDAIGAAELASDAGTEIGTATWATTTRALTASIDPTAAGIADAVWDELMSGHVISGSAGAQLTSASAGGGGGLDASGVRAAIGLASANLDTQLAARSASLVADAVWDEARTGHTTAGTFGNYLDASISGVSTGGVSASAIADAVWDEALSGHATAGSAGAGLTAASSGSGGSSDWTVDEKTAIRAILGIPSSGTTPNTPSSGVLNTINVKVDDLPTNAEMVNLVRSIVVEDQGATASVGCVNAVALAVLAGRASVSGNTVTYRDPSNNEIRAVIQHDQLGNRTASSITCPTY